MLINLLAGPARTAAPEVRLPRVAAAGRPQRNQARGVGTRHEPNL